MWSTRLMDMLLVLDFIQARSMGKGRFAKVIKWSSTFSNSKMVGRVEMDACVEMAILIQDTCRLMLSLPSRRRLSLVGSSDEVRKGSSSASDQSGSEDDGVEIGRVVSGCEPCFDWIFQGLLLVVEDNRACANEGGGTARVLGVLDALVV